jgi:hypothetical protein
MRKATRPNGPGRTQCRAAFLDALGIDALSKTAVLEAVNRQRAVLGLPPIEVLTTKTDLCNGLRDIGSEPVVQRVPKAQAASDLGTFRAALVALTAVEFRERCGKIARLVTALTSDPDSADEVKREDLLKSALALYDDEHCPVCDTPFTPDSFTEHLKKKLVHLATITKQRKEIEGEIAPLLDAIHAAESAVRSIIAYGPMLEPKPELRALIDFSTLLGGCYRQLEKFLPLEDTIAVVEAGFESADLYADVAALDAAVTALPEPSAEMAAHVFLVSAQERLQDHRAAKQEHQTAKTQSERATEAYKIFGEATTRALGTIYEEVQGSFSELYREINKPDEGTFTAELLPSLGKLGFNVDFYGRGQFPPGAFHSEGHQDAMGVCLYLALMSHLLGNGFTFAVLDDVLMSVDRSHRRELCALLKTRFPCTQFILTTHDEVWLRHMKAEGLIKAKGFAHFKTWSVDVGPAEWTNDGVWEEIDVYLAKNDIQPAAAALRHYLEYFAGEMCHRLRGSVEYRGDGNFAFGELIAGASNALADAFKKAKASANSWNKRDLVTSISQRAAADALHQVAYFGLASSSGGMGGSLNYLE